MSIVLPTAEDRFESYTTPTSRQTLRIALNLKHLIDKVIPIAVPDDFITQQGSRLLNDNVVKLAVQAAGGKGDGARGSSSRKYRSCIIFCLLKVCGWYWTQSQTELHDSELYTCRATAAQQLAKMIIELEKDERYCFISMLCRRYTICLNDEDAAPQNALELAVDMHSTIVIGSSGYQRCIKWLWRGWIVQSAQDPHAYVMYQNGDKSSFWVHFDPGRIKTPLYQNMLEIWFSFLFLALYSVVVNSRYDLHGLDAGEVTFYVFVVGFIMDEFVKFFHVGKAYFGFWNAYNSLLYSIIVISMVFRGLSLLENQQKDHNHAGKALLYGEISYRVLSTASPFVFCRLILYLDAKPFVGAMIVVVKRMMTESLIFFALLFIIMLGFLQGFLGLDISDGKRESTALIMTVMVRTVLGGADFDALSHLASPYANILYHVYCFIVSVILLNILVALYSSAYSFIYDHATDEYLALVAQKTLRYIRAPDENVFVPPLNVVEMVFLCIPLELWMKERIYSKVNYYVMLVVYSPLLTYIAISEVRLSRRVQYNRMKNLPDDANEVDLEWDLTDGFEDAFWSNESIQETQDAIRSSVRLQRHAEREDPEFSINLSEWNNRVDKVAPPVEKAQKTSVGWELYELYEKIDALTDLVQQVVEENRRLRAVPTLTETK
ncbi:hypothetical protein BABINDRAFT_39860 [Babjeviella inositovora NRRL Y-12698]|uniref:Ion transport domain-containing protein n=1 Tax=Babjeviella inositovora NRRL Y-12698 TaxID=984486 RepID=A0A1E3QL01_9ASCO|nr:uncharacterized protein BABINDRAFT_39860 [Babjeviella inositovora NRRL Y-12698]ODQ78298.1 hypothetical protein BABINDRAFT_39860 [Babjeviella inositovora NRRL Y-12698]